jgi:hypothetical protein
MTRLIIAVTFTLTTLVATATAHAQYGGFLNPNVPISGVFTPNLPMDASGKPFIDYQLVVQAPGTYQINVVSSNTTSYDPYVIIMNGAARIAADDDGGNGLNCRLVHHLMPGHYTVRVTRFGVGPVSVPTAFTISVTAAVTPPMVHQPRPRPPAMLTDAMARVMATQFYNTRSEWAGQYAITINRSRVIPMGPNAAQVHLGYSYTCIRARCRGTRSGSDQRVFYFQRFGAQWQVVRMGGHMSASF